MKNSFDYRAYREAFRAACQRRGIDPERGSNAYQAALVRADHAADVVRRANRGWWKRQRYWYHCPPYHSATEEAAIRRVFAQAFMAEISRWSKRAVVQETA